LAYGAARALPEMPPFAGVLLRGTTVVLIMAAGLWLGGFLQPEELEVLKRVRPSRAEQPSIATAADTTEFAGEIVATDLPVEEDLSPRSEQERAK
jgi:hypothetical protein